MKREIETEEAINRREFFRTFPRQLFKSLQAVREVELSAVEKQNQKARLDVTRCLAWGGMMCQACYLACHLRDRAMEMKDLKPVIHAEACDGCTMCVEACRTVNNPPALVMKDEVSA